MNEQTAIQTQQQTKYPVKAYFESPVVQQKFKELLGKRSTQFVTSVLQIVSNNKLLANAEPQSIFNAAATAATLDLPINQNLGFAYIIPYNEKQSNGSYSTVAQFQMGYKGFIQLAQRSGQFQTISATPVYEGQLIEENPLTGFVFDWKAKKSDIVVGYAAYFRLLNGFEKTLYMTTAQLKQHGQKFSQTFKKGFGLWKDDFDSMAQKTVIKLLLSKFAPLSVEMQRAVISDQAIVKDAETLDVQYINNEEPKPVDKERERILALINDCNTVDELEKFEKDIPEDMIDEYATKRDFLREQTKVK